MPIYYKNSPVTLPLRRIYHGSILKYKSNTYTEETFTTPRYPRSANMSEWITEITGLQYRATNAYGLWRIWATSKASSANVLKAFDTYAGISYGYWSYLSSDTERMIGINCPTGVAILPTRVYLTHSSVREDGTVLEGLNSIGEWVILHTLASSTSEEITETINLTVSDFYSAFRINVKDGTCKLGQFRISHGTIRMEGKSLNL